MRVEDRTDNLDSQNLVQRNRYLMAVVADLQATVTTLIAENNALRALMARLLANLKNKNLYKQVSKLLERRKEMSHNGITMCLLQKMDIRDKGERMARSPEGVEGCQEEHEGYLPRKRSRTQLGLCVEAV